MKFIIFILGLFIGSLAGFFLSLSSVDWPLLRLFFIFIASLFIIFLFIRSIYGIHERKMQLNQSLKDDYPYPIIVASDFQSMVEFYITKLDFKLAGYPFDFTSPLHPWDFTSPPDPDEQFITVYLDNFFLRIEKLQPGPQYWHRSKKPNESFLTERSEEAEENEIVLYIIVENLEDYFETIKNKGLEYLSDLVSEHGFKKFYVKDNEKNTICFYREDESPHCEKCAPHVRESYWDWVWDKKRTW